VTFPSHTFPAKRFLLLPVTASKSVLAMALHRIGSFEKDTTWKCKTWDVMPLYLDRDALSSPNGQSLVTRFAEM
jgi:hypothetical protein